jgi:hypothetical protein
VTEQTDLVALGIKIRDLMVSPALEDLVQLDPAFPADYQDTLDGAIVALLELYGLRERLKVSKDVQLLLEQRETLANALDFYADPDTWFAVAVVGDPPCGEISEDWSTHGSPDYEHGDERPGKKAREALAAVFGEDA